MSSLQTSQFSISEEHSIQIVCSSGAYPFSHTHFLAVSLYLRSFRHLSHLKVEFTVRLHISQRKIRSEQLRQSPFENKIGLSQEVHTEAVVQVLHLEEQS